MLWPRATAPPRRAGRLLMGSTLSPGTGKLPAPLLLHAGGACSLHGRTKQGGVLHPDEETISVACDFIYRAAGRREAILHQAVVSQLADVCALPAGIARALPAARQLPHGVHMLSVRVQAGELMRLVGARPGVPFPCSGRQRCARQSHQSLNTPEHSYQRTLAA